MPTPTYNDSANYANEDSFSKYAAILEASNALSDVKFIVLTLVIGFIASLYIWVRWMRTKNITPSIGQAGEVHGISTDVSKIKTEVAELNGDVRVLRGEVSSLDQRFSEYRTDSQHSFNEIFRKLDTLICAVRPSYKAEDAN